MIGFTPVIHALGGSAAGAGPGTGTGEPLRLVEAGSLLAALAFARASPGQAAGADGAWASLAADGPRFAGTARRLLVEGGRTNALANPRGEGAGTAGWPTGWGSSQANGLTVQLQGVSQVGGVSVLRVRESGTATSSAGVRVFVTGSTIAAAPGSSWTSSLFFRLVAAPSPPLSWGLQILARNSAGASVPGGGTTVFAPTAELVRYAQTAPLGDAATAFVRSGWRMGLTNGRAYDFTYEVGWPQLELAPFASSPILPPAGSPGASTRAADLATLPLTAGQAGRGTLVGTFLLPQPVPAGRDHGLLLLHDGTAGNQVSLRALPGGAIGLLRTAAGTASASGTAGTIAAGTPFRAALAWDGTGLAACVNGAAPVALAAPVPPVTALALGQGAGDPLAGEIGPLDLHPTRLPDAALQSLTTP